MARYRYVHCKFWNDDTDVMENFTPEDKYFYLYLLTNPHTTQCGIYEISPKHMMNETGYNLDTVDRLIKRFEEVHQKIKYDRETKELAIKNWARYNVTESPKVKICIERELESIKNKAFIGYVYGMDTQSQNKEKEKEKRKEKEKERGNDTVSHEVLQYLNTKAGRNYQKVNAHTTARLKEYSKEDLMAVIDWKTLEWAGGDMAKYLTQETLFSTKHFDTYLDDARRNLAGVEKKAYDKYCEEFYQAHMSLPLEERRGKRPLAIGEWRKVVK